MTLRLLPLDCPSCGSAMEGEPWASFGGWISRRKGQERENEECGRHGNEGLSRARV